MALSTAKAAAVATAVGSGAFRYNRENYMFDMGLRWGRFTTGYSMAMAQAGMYREDIRDLTTCTVTKADTYHTVGVIFFVLNFQLIMAGRLGVHGPSPPGWLMGIYWTNICSCTTYLVMFTWMAMHAGARATAGGAYMLTRHVRLPIPTPAMLDKARKTGNSYEKQRVADVFRVPFAMPAAQEKDVDPETGKTVPVSDRRMPGWYQDEIEETRQDDGGAMPGPTSNPEHFELYRGLQEEWWAYDVYSRIGVLYFMSNWLTAASLYSMAHVFTELRIVWPAYTEIACFIAAHYGILSLDIVNKPREGGFGFRVEKVVPFVPCLCVVGMTIDYSVLQPSPVAVGFIYTLAGLGYLIQFAWALRQYELAAPQVQVDEKEERPGQPWWPAHWPLPPAFEDSVYMVGAPNKLDQPCIQQEMKAAKGKRGHIVAAVKANKAPSAMLPWKLFRGALITVIAMWTLIIFGRVFEVINGERQLLKQENRVERWPSHVQGWMPPWSRKGSRNEWCHAGGCDRRLSEASPEQQEVAAMAQRLASAIGPIASALGTVRAKRASPMPPPPVFVEPRPVEVAWPSELRPAYLAAHPTSGAVAALDRTGRAGAVLRLHANGDFVEEVVPFMLQGLEGLGELIGFTWDDAGLLVTTARGVVAECHVAFQTSGAWECGVLAAPELPEGLQTAAVVRHGGSPDRLRAAVAYPGDETVVLLDADLGAPRVGWIPVGEARVAPASVAPPTLGALHVAISPSADELLVASADGGVFRRALHGHAEVERLPSPRMVPGATKSFRHACHMGQGRVAHLIGSLQGAAKLFISGGAAAAAPVA